MRLEFNPRALCYNLYCDTSEEHEKIKQMMEKPLAATDLKNIDNMIYADTDSIYKMKTKLNSLYGRMVNMRKNYLVTDDYCELEHKARLFADVFDYDSAIGEGIFQFYNSPCFRSFSFTVDPANFHADVSSYLFERFMERINNYDK